MVISVVDSYFEFSFLSHRLIPPHKSLEWVIEVNVIMSDYAFSAKNLKLQSCSITAELLT